MGTKRDWTAIDARRLQGARLLKRKVPQAGIAREIGVSRQEVVLWTIKRVRTLVRREFSMAYSHPGC
jgi:hypothetical protein